jgi:hypothetical protein
MRENPDRHVHPLPPTAYRKARICLRLRHLKSVVKSRSIPPARLKLVFPAGDQVDYEVPASVMHRGPAGEVPGARWARVHGKNGGMGFASDH